MDESDMEHMLEFAMYYSWRLSPRKGATQARRAYVDEVSWL